MRTLSRYHCYLVRFQYNKLMVLHDVAVKFLKTIKNHSKSQARQILIFVVVAPSQAFRFVFDCVFGFSRLLCFPLKRFACSRAVSTVEYTRRLCSKEINCGAKPSTL